MNGRLLRLHVVIKKWNSNVIIRTLIYLFSHDGTAFSEMAQTEIQVVYEFHLKIPLDYRILLQTYSVQGL